MLVTELSMALGANYINLLPKSIWPYIRKNFGEDDNFFFSGTEHLYMIIIAISYILQAAFLALLDNLADKLSNRTTLT